MSWLCPEPGDRLRLLEMSGRVQGPRQAVGVLMGVVSLACAPWIGWWLGPLVAVALATFGILERVLPRVRRPEIPCVTAIGLFMVVIAGAVLESNGVRSPFAGWFLVPLIMLAVRFRARVVYAGFAVTVFLAATAFIGTDRTGRRDTLPIPLAAAAWLTLVIAVLAAVMTLLHSELRSRGRAMVDPLTGLLNRAALLGRFDQAAEQAQVLSGWLSVVMLDIDHFKQINDTYGHDMGDVVLRGVAERMRATLPFSDGVFRYGGEEFLLLLPGYSAERAHEAAEQLRLAIARETYAGTTVTVSAGVSSGQGGALTFDELLRAADQALYRAKAGGRNQICAFA